jgi:hypothetical protein
MTSRLQVTDLDFDTIKTNLRSFLQQQTEFQDYDFEGSSLSVLLDILAYNTHYNAYYLNMVANEAFLDTAILRDSVVSHAKTLGYTPRSFSAPEAKITLTVETNSSNTGTLTIPRGFAFESNLIDDVSYNFVTIESTTVSKSNTQFVFENLEIYEGFFVTYVFSYTKNSNPKSIFILPDTNIVTPTIFVTVTDNTGNTASEVYNQITDILDVDASSKVFFLQEGKKGEYQIYFGNDIIGKALVDGATVTVNYLTTTGTVANKANGFVARTNLDGLSDFTITVNSVASGGALRESVDEIKYSAAAQFSTQNRLITIKDYESYIQQNYPNIDSLSVWGGEDNIPPVYGKVFISLKPKENYFISETEKQRIIDDIIKPKSIIAVQTEIIDPEFLYLLLDTTVEYDSKKTTSSEDTLKQNIRNTILSYRDTFLNKFAAKIVDSKLETSIDAVDLNAIIGNDLNIRVQKRFEPVLNQLQSYNINFNVPLLRGTITDKLVSTEFDVLDSFGTRRTVVFDEVPQSFSGISSIEITNPGTGYTSAPTITITGDGIGATAQARIVNGSIQSIQITNRGIDYTRAVVTISGGGGYGASASAIIDAKIGTLRTIYYDTNAERQIVDDNVGSIDYENGIISISDINILSVSSFDSLIRLTIKSNKNIIESNRNTIITIDEEDPISIVTNLIRI